MTRVYRLAANPGAWSCLGALLLLGAAIGVIGAHAAPALIWTTAVFASFFLIVGLGQMLVMTAGNGNIDLSIPATMTLAAYVAMVTMGGTGGSVALGVVLGLATGLACGAFNAILVIVTRIPPMIATLAVGFIVQSVAIAYSRGTTAPPAPGFASFSISSIFGVPLIAGLALAGAVVLALVVQFTVFGRSVEAIGQSQRAALFASVKVQRTVAGTYLLSGILAAAAGVLFAGYAGGASLALAEDFLVVSIAVVVIGGTNVAGGQASVLGVVGASAFYYLAVTMLNILQLNPGVRSIITGAVIMAVLAVGSRRVAR